MADLDPDFQSLLTSQVGPQGTPQGATATAQAGALDPDFADVAKQTAVAANPTPQPFSWTKFFKEQGTELGRSTARAAWALPGMAEDAGVAVANIGSGLTGTGYDRYEYPSATFNKALNQALPPPTNAAGKTGEFLSSLMLGARMPGPSQIGSARAAMNPGAPLPASVPSNFVAPLTQAQQNLAQARQAGAVFPPSTVNPTMTNKLIESVGGKAGTEQDASLANMKWADSMARKALGMDSKAEITEPALNGIIKGASSAKAKLISATGDAVMMDPEYSQGISQILDPYRQAGQELGDSFGNPQLVKAGEAIDKPQITPKVAVGAIDQLRDQAKMAFRTGDNTTGTAYKGLATNLENAIDRHLVANGSANVVDDYRAARELQAKAYDVKDALNPVTGHVDANVLKRADYLSGDLQTVGNAAQIAPKAFKQVTDSGSVRNTDIMTGGLAALMEKKPAFLLYPMARQAARAGMLSKAGQNKLIGPLGPQGAPSVGGMPQSLLGQINTQANQP